GAGPGRPGARRRHRAARALARRRNDVSPGPFRPDARRRKGVGRVRNVAVIEVIGLRRTYRTTTGILRRRPLEVEAVRGISFEVAEGELFGLLGPNGAGKTTTIKMLITLLLPTAGEARVLGHDVVREA